MPKNRVGNSLDPERLPPVDERHSYRPMNNWVRGERTVIVDADSYAGLTTPNSKSETHYTERFAEDLLRDWRRDFALREVIDLRIEAGRVVTYINQHKPKAMIARAKRAYLDGLAKNNLCWKCKLPIRVTKYADIEVTEMRHKRMNPRFNMSGRELSRVPWAHKRRHFRTVTDIPSHFEWVWEDGEHAGLRFIDGSGRDIRIERVPYTTKREAKRSWDRDKPRDADGNVIITKFRDKFVEMLEDGTTRPVVPAPVYQVYNLKCECKHRHTKERKIIVV